MLMNLRKSQTDEQLLCRFTLTELLPQLHGEQNYNP